MYIFILGEAMAENYRIMTSSYISIRKLVDHWLLEELMRPNSLYISHGDKCLKNMNLMSKIVFEVLERTNWNNDSSTLRAFD